MTSQNNERHEATDSRSPKNLNYIFLKIVENQTQRKHLKTSLIKTDK